jgi:hypothetical protein
MGRRIVIGTFDSIGTFERGRTGDRPGKRRPAPMPDRATNARTTRLPGVGDHAAISPDHDFASDRRVGA